MNTFLMKEELNNALQNLLDGNTILYPTDTVWGIGCDATDTFAVKKIFHIKKRDKTKSLVVLVDSIEMLRHYIDTIPKRAIDFLKTSEKPTTVIYNNPKKLAGNVVAKDTTVAVRIVQDEFCRQLIHKFGKPIVSTSANISGSRVPKTFKEIDMSILDAVDYVVNLQRDKISDSPSTIIRIDTKGEVEVIRE